MQAHTNPLDCVQLSRAHDATQLIESATDKKPPWSDPRSASSIDKKASRAQSAWLGVGDKSRDILGAGDDISMSYEDTAEEDTLPSSTRASPAPQSASSPGLLPLPAFRLPSTTSHFPLSGNIKSRRTLNDKPPSLAPNLDADHAADYHPWTGIHAEDVLDEASVRNGFASKQAPTSASGESNTGRPLLWPSIKNKNSLAVISALLVQVMDKRQQLGRCTAQSTFKPPPRVTLIDARREAWLKDLASDQVPLRRLSRSIPHGIRGKILLDQCSSKRVPLSRAIWLIQCVGANEIRAFRRKGVSGSLAHSAEIKWIKEWTSAVEQFVASTVSACGSKDWKNDMIYTTKLLSALFVADLLDRNQTLDWVVGCFITSADDQLPIWVHLIRIFWGPLCATQRRGHKLVLALLTRISALRVRSRQSHDFLLSQLCGMVQSLAETRSECLLALPSWAAHRETLEYVSSFSSNGKETGALAEIVRRNGQLNATAQDIIDLAKSVRLRLFEYLDLFHLPSSIELNLQGCRKVCPDQTTLVTGLVDWASSAHRQGDLRLYLAAKILRDLSLSVPDFEVTIFSSHYRSIDRNDLLFTRLVLELLRTNHFDFGKYLLWLVSTGLPSNPSSPYLSIIRVVRPEQLSNYSRALRSAIISRSGLQTSNTDGLARVHSWLAGLDAGIKSDNSTRDILHVVSVLDVAGQRDVAQWMMRHLEGSTNSSSLDRRNVAIMRSILEIVGDYAGLVVLLRCSFQADDTDLLLDAAAILTMHLEIFKALEVAQDLTRLLLQRRALIKALVAPNRLLTHLLVDLCARQSVLHRFVPTLKADLNLGPHGAAAMVCSPASDSVLNVQAGDITSDGDIDRILTSGNVMDEKILTRLFSAIVERTVKWSVASFRSIEPFSRWFAQLRSFDSSVFDRLALNLLGKLTGNAGTDQVRAILMALVCSASLQIDEAFQVFLKRLDILETGSAPQLARFASGVIQTFMPLEDLSGHAVFPDIYQWRVLQQRLMENNPHAFIKLIYHGLTAPSESAPVLRSTQLQKWLASICVSAFPMFAGGMRLATPPEGHHLKQLMQFLLELSSSDDDYRAGSTPLSIMSSKDELLVPFVRALTQLMSHRAAPTHEVDIAERSIDEITTTAIEQDSPLWMQMLNHASTDIRRDQFQKAVSHILAKYSSAGPMNGRSSIKDLHIARISVSGATPDLLSALNDIKEALVVVVNQTDGNADRAAQRETLSAGCEVLLDLAACCVNCLSSESLTSAVLEQLTLVSCQLYTRMIGKVDPKVIENVWDHCSLFSQGLSGEQLSSIMKALPEIGRHSKQLGFILDVVDSDYRWLFLASRNSAAQSISAGASQATMSPTSTQSPFTSLSRSAPMLAAQASWASNGLPSSNPPSAMPSPQPPATPQLQIPQARWMQMGEPKYTSFMPKPWELIQDVTPNMGTNDTSLSVALFRARKVL